jgi:hypothetical protein
VGTAEKLLERIRQNVLDVRFADLCRLARLHGFRERGRKGSHRVYVKDGVAEMLNFQEVKGRAKPYQVRQLLQVIERYGLEPKRGVEDD